MPSADRVATLFGAIALSTVDAMREATESAAGLSDAAPAALVSLLQHDDGLSIDELRRIVGLTSSGGVRLVDRLEAAELAERSPGPNRRTVTVTLTARGRRIAHEVLAARHEVLEGLLRPLTSSDRRRLEAIAERLLSGAVTQRLARRSTGDVPTGGWMCRMCDHAACGRDAGRCPAKQTAIDEHPGDPDGRR